MILPIDDRLVHDAPVPGLEPARVTVRVFQWDPTMFHVMVCGVTFIGEFQALTLPRHCFDDLAAAVAAGHVYAAMFARNGLFQRVGPHAPAEAPDSEEAFWRALESAETAS